MDLIDLEDDTIDAEVLDSLAVTMEDFRVGCPLSWGHLLTHYKVRIVYWVLLMNWVCIMLIGVLYLCDTYVYTYCYCMPCVGLHWNLSTSNTLWTGRFGPNHGNLIRGSSTWEFYITKLSTWRASTVFVVGFIRQVTFVRSPSYDGHMETSLLSKLNKQADSGVITAYFPCCAGCKHSVCIYTYPSPFITSFCT